MAIAATLPRANDDDAARLRFIVGAMLLHIGLSVVSSLLRLGWESAAAIVVVVDAAYIAFIVRWGDRLLLRILVLAFFAGCVELIADWYAVDATRTLIYPKGEPFIARSPLYMPLAWVAVLVQLGYIGWWLSERRSLLFAAIVTGIIGGINIPIYEHLARRAGWWHYRLKRVPSLFDAPWYIIGAEFLIAIVLPPLVVFAARRLTAWSSFVGVALGLWMWLATALAFALLG